MGKLVFQVPSSWIEGVEELRELGTQRFPKNTGWNFSNLTRPCFQPRLKALRLAKEAAERKAIPIASKPKKTSAQVPSRLLPASPTGCRVSMLKSHGRRL